jgi:hypothetical protein
MSDDGSYVFFDTADALVPQDSNGTLDVYEWEVQGTGGCESPQGYVHLISSGEDPAPSFFLGVSVDGSNVFFGTHARLVPQDTDTNGDLYDARICEAESPCIGPPVGETAQCEGDACQNPPSAPIDSTPASLTFSGAGNLAPEVKPPAKLTNAQKLAKALKVCKRDHSKQKRAGCELQARKRYGPKKKPLSSKLHGKPKRSSRGKGRE